jgi:hypothetical protein
LLGDDDLMTAEAPASSRGEGENVKLYRAEMATTLRSGKVALGQADMRLRVDAGQVRLSKAKAGGLAVAEIVDAIQLKTGTVFGWDGNVKGMQLTAGDPAK